MSESFTVNGVQYTSPKTAEDVTEEMVDLVRNILDGWYQDTRINWGDVWDRAEGTELADGTRLDMGTDLMSPALKEIKRQIRADRCE